MASRRISVRAAERAREEEVEARLAQKFSNFKEVQDAWRHSAETETVNRQLRYEAFQKRALQVGNEEQLRLAWQRFKVREQRGVIAKCKKWTTDDFEAVHVLGQGSFGTVWLCRVKGVNSSGYVALKQTQKHMYQQKNTRVRLYSERDVLSRARSMWVVDLFATFQDADHTYMAMEFLQGGDLLSHLDELGYFDAWTTRFYMAELLLAIEVVHDAGFVHRDLKPENIVLSDTGHLKLLDFGLCANFASDRGVCVEDLENACGTVHYMAPECSGRIKGCGPPIDVWAVGTITYELLTGDILFKADTRENGQREVMRKIERHEKVVPQRINDAWQMQAMDEWAEAFLYSVLTDKRKRATVEECQRSHFFADIVFETLHLEEAPIQPEVTNPEDVSFPSSVRKELPKVSADAWKDVPSEWVDYEYDRRRYELNRPSFEVEEIFLPPKRSSVQRPVPREQSMRPPHTVEKNRRPNTRKPRERGLGGHR
eukprot:CAMPEP_0194496578 /NCGR_PEP_ID=MMETSP0253-20130528/13805_1 /TAXON_ID=2966 /ORGANISM="Noctiluca scintillans" /LENGTH=483 /DNA_ID=CAMNT_0039337997 /DNA_START=54 /DNA_END=1505 /DNA_ORIENTATION=-